MAKVSEMFPTKWLSAVEVEGKIFKLVISSYGKETYDDGDKMTINFQGAKKGMVLNHTNRGTLVWLFGDEADQWIGQTVELFTEPVNFKGKISAGLKLRGVAAAPTALAPAAATALQAPLGQNGGPPVTAGEQMGPQSGDMPGGPGEQAAAVAQPMATSPDDLEDSIPF